MENLINKLFIKDKYHLAGYVFDCFLDVQHSMQAQITDHPVQYGSVISDHAIIQPERVTFQLGVSDCKLVFGQDDFSNIKTGVLDYTKEYIKNYSNYKEAAGGSLNDSRIITPWAFTKMKALEARTQSRSKNAMQILEALYLARIPLDCATRLKSYSNMLIESIQASENNQTGETLIATVTLREVPMAMVQKVQTKSTYHATEKSTSGSKNPLDIKAEIKEKSNESTKYVEMGRTQAQI